MNNPWQFPEGYPDSVPVNPSFEAKLQFLAKFMMDPCDAPLTVYLELGAPHFGNIIFGLTAPQAIDIAQNIHQPKTLGGCRRKRGGRRGGKPIRGIPSLDDLVADKVNDSRSKPRQTVGGRKAWLYAGAGLLQRAAFQWYAATLAFDEVYNWLSAVQATGFCQAAENGKGRWLNASYKALSNLDGATLPWLGDATSKGPGYTALSGVGNSREPQAVACGGTLTAIGPDAWSGTFNLIGQSGGENHVLDSHGMTLQVGESTTFAMSGRNNGPGLNFIQIEATGGGFNFTEGSFLSLGIGGPNVKGF